MYFKDLDPLDYGDSRLTAANAVAVGWLSQEHDYPRGRVPSGFVNRLRHFARFHVIEHRGFHFSDLHENRNKVGDISAQTDNGVRLGSRVFCAFSNDQAVYAAPDLIIHYVVEHLYQPPQEFVDAIMDGPQPGSEGFASLVRPLIDPSDVKALARNAARELAAVYGFTLDRELSAVPTKKGKL